TVEAAMSSGSRTPMRSTRRPANTPSAMGSAAKSDMMTPTVSGEAPMPSAVREMVSRLPLNATCARTVVKTSSASGTGASAAPRFQRRDAFLDRRVAREKSHEPVASFRDAEGLQRLRQRIGLEPSQAAQGRHHRPRRAQQASASRIGAEFALAREPRDDERGD